VPVRDPALSVRVEEILRANLEDDTLAWELGADGLDEGSRRVGQRSRAAPRAGGGESRGGERLNLGAAAWTEAWRRLARKQVPSWS
jgi:hypothetical protein